MSFDHAGSWQWLWAAGALSAIVGCAQPEPTTCRIQVGDYIGPTVGYWYDDRDYCVHSQAECEETCAQLAGRPDIGVCEWRDTRYCWDGDLPPSLAQSEVCAIHLTVACGGGSGDTSVLCGSCGTLTPGTSEYDPSTDCLTQRSSTIGRGTSCAEATVDLEGGSGATCQWVNDDECDEPEGTNLCPEGSDFPDCP